MCNNEASGVMRAHPFVKASPSTSYFGSNKSGFCVLKTRPSLFCFDLFFRVKKKLPKNEIISLLLMCERGDQSCESLAVSRFLRNCFALMLCGIQLKGDCVGRDVIDI